MRIFFQYIYYVILPTIWLFTIYIIARIIKTPLWDTAIDPYGSWKYFDEQVLRDTTIVFISALCTVGFIFLSWWWFLICLGFAILNLTVFFIWLWRKSRKDGKSTSETISLLKSNAMSKFRKKR